MLPWQHLCQQMSCTGTRLLKVYDGTAGHTRRVDWKGWLRWRSGKGANHEIPLLERKRESVNHSVMSDSLLSHGLTPSRLLYHGFLQARILECIAIPFSRESSQTRIEPGSLALQADSLPSEPTGQPRKKMQRVANEVSNTRYYKAREHQWWWGVPWESSCHSCTEGKLSPAILFFGLLFSIYLTEPSLSCSMQTL